MAELVDTNSATAKATDILQGKTAYVKSGLVVGTIPMQAGGEIIPGTASKTAIERGIYTGGDIAMVGDANLDPENIAKGITIFGVKGTWEGEPPPPTLPDGFYEINVSSEPEGAGQVIGGGIASLGTIITVTAEGSEWHEKFSEWREEGKQVSYDNKYKFTVTEGRNLCAVFSLLPHYTISAITNPNGAGVVSGAGAYSPGEDVKLSVEENWGYRFLNWKENGTIVHSEKEYAFIADKDRSLTVDFFTIPRHTISATADPEASGSISGTGVYLDGESVALIANLNLGYTFKEWVENGVAVSQSTTYTFDADSDRHLVALSTKDLPDGYKQVEYIRNTGFQCIDTGVIPDPQTYITMTVQPTHPSQSAGYFFYSSNSSSNSFYMSIMSNKIYARLGKNNAEETVKSSVDTSRLTVEMDAYAKTAYATGGIRKTFDNSTLSGTNTIKLLGNGSTTAWTIEAILYSCKIYTGSSLSRKLVRDFVPCISPEGIAGLFDKVGVKFYPSITSFDFESPA